MISPKEVYLKHTIKREPSFKQQRTTTNILAQLGRNKTYI